VVENKTEDPTKTSVEVKVEEVEEKVEEKTEEKVEEKVEDKPETDPVEMEKALTAMFTSMAEEVNKAISDSILPLQEKISSLEARLIQSEKSVEEKVVERLSELPPVAKVRATFVAPTTRAPVEGEVEKEKSRGQILREAIEDLVEKSMRDRTNLKLEI
jgi:hypothetical protein